MNYDEKKISELVAEMMEMTETGISKVCTGTLSPEDKLRLYDILASEESDDSVPTIKDSGDRTEFATGAVRDMREGKGRCDLMPLDVVAKLYIDNDYNILGYISYFTNCGDIDYLYDALEIFSDLTYGGSYETMLLEVAKHFEEGAKKYGENNWQKGIPVHCYIDSAVRHYLKYLRGDKDEPHDRAFVWNIMCCIWTCGNKPELNEYANKEGRK